MKALNAYVVRYRFTDKNGTVEALKTLIGSDSVEEASEIFTQQAKDAEMEDELEIRSISYKGVIYMK